MEWFEEYNESLDEYVSTGGFENWDFSITNYAISLPMTLGIIKINKLKSTSLLEF